MNKKQPTLTDYMVIAISPALIMVMVGSLVFYVIAVLCNGHFEARLCYIAALFVFASVLIARIAMEEGRAYASMYAFALGAAVLLVMGRFTTFGFPASVGIVLLILWCTDKLTWDCTLVDGSEDTSSQGLLQIAGLEKTEASEDNEDADDPLPASENVFNPDDEGLVVAAMNNPDAAMREATEKAKSWWSRLKRRPNKPGVWVIYFSLAALPIFGFLQWFIAEDAKYWAFILLCVYLASGFGLLVNTSFLGLRQYLRNRNLEMPGEMAAVWLGAGAAKIAALMLLIGALTFVIWMLPASDAADKTSEFLTSFLPEDDPETSQYGFGNDGPQADEETNRTGPRGETPGDEESDTGEGGKDGEEGRSGEGDAKEDDPQGKGDKGKEGENGSDGEEKKNGNGDSEKQDGSKGDKGEKSKSKRGGSGGSQSGQGSSGGKQQSSGDGQSKSKQEQQNSQQQQQQAQQQQQSPSTFWSTLKSWLEILFKFAFWLIVIIAALVCAWFFRDEIKKIWQTIVEKLRQLWAMLFGRTTEAEKAAARQPENNEPPPRPFSDFADPFKSGMVNQATPEQMVEYCFAAFEAWAREHGCPRHPEKTPHEFVYEVGLTESLVADAGQAVADLYCQAAFAPGTMNPSDLQRLHSFWPQLEAASALNSAIV